MSSCYQIHTNYCQILKMSEILLYVLVASNFQKASRVFVCSNFKNHYGASGLPRIGALGDFLKAQSMFLSRHSWLIFRPWKIVFFRVFCSSFRDLFSTSIHYSPIRRKIIIHRRIMCLCERDIFQGVPWVILSRENPQEWLLDATGGLEGNKAILELNFLVDF